MARRTTRILGLTKCLCYLVAGALFGAGLLLYGQWLLAERMRDEVRSTFFLWKAIGDVTYFLQGEQVQVALTLSKLPDGAMEHTKRIAITLAILGGLLALLTPWIRRRARS